VIVDLPVDVRVNNEWPEGLAATLRSTAAAFSRPPRSPPFQESEIEAKENKRFQGLPLVVPKLISEEQDICDDDGDDEQHDVDGGNHLVAAIRR